MADRYATFYTGPEGPSKQAFAVTPTNDANLALVTTQLYVGNTGNVHVRMAGDTANTVIPFVPAGTMLRIRVKQVHSTGTTATNIVAFS